MLERKLLQFKSIRLQNFLSYIEAFLTLNDKGLVLISGIIKKNKKSNGAGKSALIADALSWALFGETIRDIKVGKIPNRFTKGECSVTLNFAVEGHDYFVVRSMRPNALHLFVDGIGEANDKSESTIAETTKKIADIIKMDFDEFVNSILFGQNIQKYFFLLKDAKQKDMIDNIINIAEEVERYKASSKALKEQAEAANATKTLKIHELNAAIESAKVRITDIERKEADFSANKSHDFDTAIAKLQQFIEEIDSNILVEQVKIVIIDSVLVAALKAKESKLRDGIGKLSSLSITTKQTLSKAAKLPLAPDGSLMLYQSAEARLEEELVVIKTKLIQDVANANAAITANNRTITACTQKVKSVADMHNADCPTCGRLVDNSCVDTVKAAYESTIQDSQTQNAQLSELALKGQQAITNLDAAIMDRKNQALFTEVSTAGADLKKYEDMLTILQGQIKDVTEELTKFDTITRANYAVESTIASLRTTKAGHERNQATLIRNKATVATSSTNPYIGMKEKEQSAIDSHNKEIVNIQKEMDGFLKIVEASKYWLKAFGDKDGVKSYIYAKIFPYLNERCNHYLKLLSNGEMTASIGLDDKDRFVVDTDNTYGADAYGGNCLIGDSLVSMANGAVKYIKDVKQGDAVLSVYPNNGVVSDYVTEDAIFAGVKDVYKISMEGREIEASDNHPFLTLQSAISWKNERRNWLEWKLLKELKNGDIIAIMSNTPERKNPIGIDFSSYINTDKSKEDLMRLLGFYLGDGWIRDRGALEGYEFSLAVFDAALEDVYKNIMTSLFGVKKFGKVSGVLTTYSKKLVRMIQSLNLHGKSFEKTIPDWVMTLPNRLKEAFIQGYLDSDGHEGKNYWKFEATSELLIKKLRMMCIHMGYRVSTITHRDRSDKQTIILGKVVKKKHASWGFSVYHNCTNRVTSTIYGDTSMLPEYLHYKKISSILPMGKKDTYDIKIRNSHNFFANGILVHNSGGERRRIDMAVMFALHDLVASRKYKSNILILDEIFDSMDTNGIDTAMSLLHDISNEYDSIFVISHTDMQEYFDNHIYIIKDGTTSVVTDSLEALNA